MKVKIHYRYDGQPFAPYWAYTTVNGKYFSFCGDTFNEAREKLKQDVSYFLHPEAAGIYIPPDEEVEI